VEEIKMACREISVALMSRKCFTCGIRLRSQGGDISRICGACRIMPVKGVKNESKV
jgi:hypothetical protein